MSQQQSRDWETLNFSQDMGSTKAVKGVLPNIIIIIIIIIIIVVVVVFVI